MNTFRRWVTVFVLGFFLAGSCTGTALAGQGKEQFVNNIAAYQNAALEVIPDLSGMVSGEIHFQVDMTGWPQDDLTVPQAMAADIQYKADAVNSRAWFKVKGSITMQAGKQPFEIESFYDDGILIVPAASMRSLNPILFGNLPYQYLYTDLSGQSQDQAEFFETLVQASSQRQQMTAAYQDVINTLIKPLPDQCFSTAGSGSCTLKMDYADLMVVMQAFQDPAFQEEIAAKMASLMPSGAAGTEPDMTESFSQPADASVSDGPDKVQVRQFEIITSPNNMSTACDMSMSDEEMQVDFALGSKGELSGGKLVSAADLSARVKNTTSDGFDALIDASIQETDTASSIALTGGMNLQVTEDGRTGKMGLSLSANARQDSGATIDMPVLTEVNSIDISAITGKKDATSEDQAIMLENGGEWSVLLGAYLEQGRMMVSVFDLSHSVGLQQTQTEPNRVTLSDGTKQVTITVGSSTYQVGDELKPLEVPAVYREYEIFVPIRIILEEFGYHVTLDETTDTLHVTR